MTASDSHCCHFIMTTLDVSISCDITSLFDFIYPLLHSHSSIHIYTRTNAHTHPLTHTLSFSLALSISVSSIAPALLFSPHFFSTQSLRRWSVFSKYETINFPFFCPLRGNAWIDDHAYNASFVVELEVCASDRQIY